MDPAASGAGDPRRRAEQCVSVAEKLLVARDLEGCKQFASQALAVDPNTPGAEDLHAAAAALLAGQRHRLPNGQPDPYAVLGLDLANPASRLRETIQSHYRRLSFLLNRYHPDRPCSVAFAEASRLVADAWAFLSDSLLKSALDAELDAAAAAAARAYHSPAPSRPQLQPQSHVSPRPTLPSASPSGRPTLSARPPSPVVPQPRPTPPRVVPPPRSTPPPAATLARSAPPPAAPPIRSTPPPAAPLPRTTPPQVGSQTRPPPSPLIAPQIRPTAPHSAPLLWPAPPPVVPQTRPTPPPVAPQTPAAATAPLVAPQTPAAATAPSVDSGTPPSSTFWTMCKACYNIYQYDHIYEKRKLRCENCQQPFLAEAMADPPPIVPGTDMYYCTWGFFPIGFPGCPGYEKMVASQPRGPGQLNAPWVGGSGVAKGNAGGSAENGIPVSPAADVSVEVPAVTPPAKPMRVKVGAKKRGRPKGSKNKKKS